MTIRQLSIKKARQIALKQQFLLEKSNKKASIQKNKAQLLSTIQQLGYVQIDSISVIERAHHHVLWTRLPTYQKEWLDSLLAERKIFEYWGHAASYLPMEDFRFSLPRKAAFASGEKHWFDRDKKMMASVLNRIRSDGPLMARDFKATKNQSGIWWNWKPAKIALEQLFMEGQLMISKRQGFQKVYDLPENVLPSTVDMSMPTENEYLQHLIDQAFKTYGVLQSKDIAYLRRGLKKKIQVRLLEMQEAHEIEQVEIEGLEGIPYWMHRSVLPILKQKTAIKSGLSAVHFLGPFDNLIIQRHRCSQLFSFDYKLECYVPAAKRVIGYFTLPILWGDSVVGQMDCKAHRKEKLLMINTLVFQDDFKKMETFLPIFVKKLRSFAAFNACLSVRLGTSLPTNMKSKFHEKLEQLLNS